MFLTDKIARILSHNFIHAPLLANSELKRKNMFLFSFLLNYNVKLEEKNIIENVEQDDEESWK